VRGQAAFEGAYYSRAPISLRLISAAERLLMSPPPPLPTPRYYGRFNLIWRGLIYHLLNFTEEFNSASLSRSYRTFMPRDAARVSRHYLYRKYRLRHRAPGLPSYWHHAAFLPPSYSTAPAVPPPLVLRYVDRRLEVTPYCVAAACLGSGTATYTTCFSTRICLP